MGTGPIFENVLFLTKMVPVPFYFNELKLRKVISVPDDRRAIFY